MKDELLVARTSNIVEGVVVPIPKLPLIVWFPMKVFEPVVANDADFATNIGSVSL